MGDVEPDLACVVAILVELSQFFRPNLFMSSFADRDLIKLALTCCRSLNALFVEKSFFEIYVFGGKLV